MNNNLRNAQYIFQQIVNELSTLQIIHKGKTLNLITTLKQIYRTGTAIRLDKFNLNLPKQSLFDHSVSLSYIADVLKEELNLEIDILKLAHLCIFHDLPEIVTGDVPDHTSKELAGKHYKTKREKFESESEAIEIIIKQLPKNISKLFDECFYLLKNKQDSNTFLFFMMIDKSEPIMSMWRYINIYKDIIDIEKFLEAMTDFFVNPAIEKYAINDELGKLIVFLLNKDNAREYFKNGNTVFDSLNSEKLKSCAIQLISPRKIS